MYAILMKQKKLAAIEKRIEKIKQEIVLIGPMRPGSLTRQYKDPKKKEGGYYQISYTHEMKSRTEYVRKECVREVREQIKNYKRFKQLMTLWVSLSIEQSKLWMKQTRDGD